MDNDGPFPSPLPSPLLFLHSSVFNCVSALQPLFCHFPFPPLSLPLVVVYLAGGGGKESVWQCGEIPTFSKCKVQRFRFFLYSEELVMDG